MSFRSTERQTPLLIVCCTLLIFTYLTRNRLCEVRLKDGNREVTASLAYESNGK
ncbi:TPA: Hok/Gef family protein [Escherichia coli]|nr:Hok/Gef family protein [Escherichia coli]HAZ7902054.1 Hok/Gef family protein [Escherichia coli]